MATSDGALGKAGDGDARIALTGKGAVTATALANGGNAAVRSNTNPAEGVAGAAATAQASASTSSVTSKAIASATAIGGNGSVAIGAGNTGGAGGVASVLTTTATGPVAEATAIQRGGNGGVGLYGAKGANGADSVMINRVAGRAPGGTLALTQTSVAGAGGEAPGGVGGGGGYAISKLTIDDSATATGAAQLSGRVTAIGGAGGLGSVGTGVGGHDAYGQAGGYAYAQAQLKGRRAVTVDVSVSGGAGGGTDDGDVNGADGGSAGGASIVETTALNDRAIARAYLYGGNGGRANGAGRTGGAGGSVGLARVYGTGASATSLLVARGGLGGAGSGGASGGAGGAVTLTDAVRASVRRGDINLSQNAFGGGGGDGAYGGDAGDAVSSLTFDDTLNPIAATSLRGRAYAFGADGGYGSLGHGAGSDVAASLNLRATNSIIGYAATYAGNSFGRGGNAAATSKATALGSGATAFSYAKAIGGLGYTRGEASAMSTAETADGALAQAGVRAGGAISMGEAAATTHTSDIVTTVTAHATAAQASAAGEVNAGKMLTGPSAAYDSYVLATAAPDATTIAAVVNATANVAAALGSNLTAIVGTGLMGGKSTPLNTQYAGHTDWTLNTTMRSGRLVLALTGWTSASANIASLTVRTSVDGVTVTDATFTDTATAKAYVTDNVLDLGATPVGEAVSVSVSYSIQFTGAFEDFAFRYVLAATNTAVTDTIAPLAPSLTMPRADDTGVFDFDRVTNLAQPRLGGIAEPAAFVDIYDGGVLLDTATASLTGGWTYTPTVPLAEGKHTLTAIARDAAGNSSAASQVLALEIDTIAPTAPAAPDLLARTDRGRFAVDNLTTAGPVSFTGLTDPYHSIEVFNGAASLGTTVADATGRWTLDVSTALAGGTHTITVKVTDIAGNTSDASAPLVVTVDTAVTAPAALDLATTSDTGRLPYDDITRDVQPQIVGTADAGATVRLFDGITEVGSAIANSLGRWRITSVPLADGVHSLVAQATDAAGNVSDTSQALLVTIDTTAPDAPVVTLHNQSDSGTKDDMVTNVVAPTIRGLAEIGSIITVHDGATLLGSRTIGDTGTGVLTLPTLPAGANTLKVTATDAAGNAVTTDVSIEIDVEALPPSAPDLADVSDLGLSSTDDLTGDTTPTFTGSAEALSTVTLLAGSTVLGTGSADLSGAWTITAIALAPGSHGITARIVDRAGNASAESDATTVTIDVTASAPPDAPDLDAGSESGASDSDNRTSISNPMFTGTTEAGVTVVLYDGDTEIGRTTASPSGAWSITSPALSDGAHAITARRTNLPGNLSAASAPLTVLIDTAAEPPTMPDLRASHDTGASDTDDITQRSFLRFDGTGEANAAIILREGTTVIGTGSANAAGAWSIATSVLAEGTHLITAEQVDVAGNKSVASLAASVLIDRTAPSAPAVGSVSPLAVGGTAEAFAQVTVYEGATVLGSGVADGTGTWSAAVTLSAGDHLLTVQAADRAGNVSVMSPTRAVTIGSGGNDVLFTPGAQLMGGGAGDDLYLVDDAGDDITEAAGDGSDTVLASVGFTLPAIAAIEFLFADSGAGLTLGGNDLVNTIRGGAGADTLTGGGGGDTLMGSGGVDTFRYTALSDSTSEVGHLDTILDFNAAIGEALDLSALDADLTIGGDQAFSFIGNAAFTAAGQVRAETVGGVTLVSGNVDAALGADFTIALTGSHTLTGAHFVL